MKDAEIPEMPVMRPLNAEAPKWLVQEVRSDQAGETGAVAIYRGILAVSRDPAVRSFAEAHRQTEQRHLEQINAILPKHEHSKLLGLWRIAGWITGALPALFGALAVFLTIEAVETFVDRHYTQQIDRLETEPDYTALRDLMITLRDEELHHRDDAAGRLTARPGVIGKLWSWIVARGSETAVVFARRI